MRIIIVDSGVANVRSVEKGLAYVGVPAKITSDPSDIDAADGIVLPGVGAIESGMGQIEPIRDVIMERVNEGVPMLGICLGMQMLFEESEEGGLVQGLGLVKGIEDGSFVYFVHSYKAPVSGNTVASSDYGEDFAAIVACDTLNVTGTQFHPEKSGAVGLRMLKNFAKMV